jgi:hypothetical protein
MTGIATSWAAAIALAGLAVTAGTPCAASAARMENPAVVSQKETIYLPQCLADDLIICSRIAPLAQQ